MAIKSTLLLLSFLEHHIQNIFQPDALSERLLKMMLSSHKIHFLVSSLLYS